MDESLYLRVHWHVARHDHGEVWTTIKDFDEDAVYRLDPADKVLRRLPMEKAREIIEWWPGATGENWIDTQMPQPHGFDIRAGSFVVAKYVPRSGWIGGRYIIYTRLERDTTFVGYKNSDTNQPMVGVEPWKPSRHLIYDIETEFEQPIDIPARLSPDDRYVVYIDSKDNSQKIYWIDNMRHATLSETFQISRPDPYEILQPVLFYPTTQGLLDPESQLIINPETYETSAGWEVFLPVARDNLLSPTGEYLAVIPKYPALQTVQIRAAKQVERIGILKHPIEIEFDFPTETVRRRVPEKWKDLRSYPLGYNFRE